jgi:hypothetical protein
VKVFKVPHTRYSRDKGNTRLTDPRDIYEMIANQGARRLRACILGVIPGDVVEAAMHQAEITLNTKAEVTPERLKALVEKFAEFGVSQEQIEKYIQRRLDAITPALLVRLGKIYNSIKEGMSKPADWFDAADRTRWRRPASQTSAVKEKAKAAAAKRAPPAAAGACAAAPDRQRPAPITDEAVALQKIDEREGMSGEAAPSSTSAAQPFYPRASRPSTAAGRTPSDSRYASAGARSGHKESGLDRSKGAVGGARTNEREEKHDVQGVDREVRADRAEPDADGYSVDRARLDGGRLDWRSSGSSALEGRGASRMSPSCHQRHLQR